MSEDKRNYSSREKDKAMKALLKQEKNKMFCARIDEKRRKKLKDYFHRHNIENKTQWFQSIIDSLD